MIVVFDKGSHSFRNDMYAEYKANRDETPEDLVPQFPLVREAATAFGVPVVELEGFEADDIIATYAKQAAADGRPVTVVSSDKDLMQLIGDGIEMFDPMKSKEIGRDEVFEKFGVGPEKVRDVLALAGDSSDNVPGVPGIGVKTAALLLEEFGDLESLLAGAETIKQKKRRENLIEFSELARISQKLVTLHEEAPLPKRLDEIDTVDVDYAKLLEFARNYNFNTLSKRLEALLTGGARPPAMTRPSPVTDGRVIRHDQRACRVGCVACSRESQRHTCDRYRDHLAGCHEGGAGRGVSCGRAGRGRLCSDRPQGRFRPACGGSARPRQRHRKTSTDPH